MNIDPVRQTDRWEKDPQWRRFEIERPCRRMTGHYQFCRKNSHFAFRRSNGYWFYCEDHMYGRKVVDGVVMVGLAPSEQKKVESTD